MFASAKERQQKSELRQLQCQEQSIDLSHITFRMHIKIFFWQPFSK